MITIDLKSKNFKVFFYIIAFVLFSFLFYMYSSLIFLFMLAYFISYMFEPVIKFLEKKKLSRPYSVTFVWVIITGLTLLVIFPIMFSLLHEISVLPPKLSEYSSRLTSTIDNIRKNLSGDLSSGPGGIISQKILLFLDYFNLSEQKIVSFFVDNFNNFVKYSGGFIGKNITKFISSFVWIFTVPVIAFYFMMDFKDINLNFNNFISRKDYRALIMEIQKEISRFFRGQLIICLIIGTLMGLGFLMIGVDFPHLLGVIAGFANLIPYFGVFASTALAVVFSILKFGFTVELLFILLKIIILVVIVQFIDGFVLSPRILSTTLELSPVYIMFFLFAGGQYGGIPGMFLAIPALIVVKVVLKYMEIKS
ncbi:MAG: AI-2E family transporter [Candidatus Muirbacterium halophilum]|nr:AI-2E family transporter [Candidatus Muirbacterium halophilum]MCK9476430.1 AI-2E family transporter [Candidatus Muirbacterium halophilum]